MHFQDPDSVPHVARLLLTGVQALTEAERSACYAVISSARDRHDTPNTSELCRLARVSRSSYYALRDGRAPSTSATVRALAAQLDCEAEISLILDTWAAVEPIRVLDHTGHVWLLTPDTATEI